MSESLVHSISTMEEALPSSHDGGWIPSSIRKVPFRSSKTSLNVAIVLVVVG